MRKFYYDFAAAYGTLWLLMFIIVILTQSSVKLGGFGMIGFPLISFTWAIIMRSSGKATMKNEILNDQQLEELRQKIAEVELTKKLYKDGGLPFTE